MAGGRIVFIDSSGTGDKTFITTQEGVVVEGALSADVHLEANCINTVRLTFMGIPLRIDANVDEVVMVCAVCGHEDRHTCSNAAPEDDDTN